MGVQMNVGDFSLLTGVGCENAVGGQNPAQIDVLPIDVVHRSSNPCVCVCGQ